MIEDSLKVYAPGGNGIAGCAAELVYNLHFADAAVIIYEENHSPYSIVTVIEPDDSARVHYKLIPTGPDPLLPEYKYADSLFWKDYRIFQIALINYPLFRKGKADSVKTELSKQKTDTAAISKIWNFLTSKNDTRSKQTALWVSLNNQNPNNRVVAASILANFPNDNICWWTLMEVLRDKDIYVNNTGRMSLKGLAKYFPEKVDWQPCVSTLRYLLSGTNLFAFNTVLNALQKTDISPALAAALLKDQSSGLLFAYANAKHNQERELALNLLKKLSGLDFGNDLSAWQKWAEGLNTSSIKINSSQWQE